MGHRQLLFLTMFETGFEPGVEVRRRLYGGKVSKEQQCPTDFRVMLRTTLAFSDVSLHANQLDPGEGVVYEG